MIAKDISLEDELASFGFLGAPKMVELDVDLNKPNINADNTVSNTKRYTVYTLYVRRFYNPLDFEYIESNTASIMLLRNNKNKEILTKDIAEKFIINEIIPNL